jgi:hypothetical protein
VRSGRGEQDGRLEESGRPCGTADPGIKKAAQRPAAKEGGRREEENRSGISAGDTGRLCNSKTGGDGGLVSRATSPHANFDGSGMIEFRPCTRFAAVFL